MSRRALIAAQIVAAVLALGCIALSLLDRIMKPSSAAVDAAQALAFALVLALTVVNLASVRRSAVALAIVLTTLVAGAAPIAVGLIDANLAERQSEIWRRDENVRQDAKAIERIANRRRDVEARLAANRPYAGADAQDALEFVNEVSYVDLKYLGLPDRSDDVRELLRRAFAAKLLDPNVMVKGPRPVDVAPEPLFLHYYRANIRPYPKASVSARDWETFKLLVASGADLSLAPGFPIAAEVQKGLTQDQFGNWRLD